MEATEFDIVNLLNDKRGLMKNLLKTIMDCDKDTKGLLAMKERGFSTEGMLENAIKVTAKQAQQIKYLALVALLFAQDDHFESSVAKMMVKMGREEEALRAMFDAKMKGQNT